MKAHIGRFLIPLQSIIGVAGSVLVASGCPTAPSTGLPGAPDAQGDCCVGGDILWSRGDIPLPLDCSSNWDCRAGDALLFAYENQENFSHAMIFAQDETKKLYWNFPAWLSAQEDPMSIPVERGPARHELPEAISHDFVPGNVTLFVVLSQTPFRAREVEAQMAKAPLRLEGARVETLVLRLPR